MLFKCNCVGTIRDNGRNGNGLKKEKRGSGGDVRVNRVTRLLINGGNNNTIRGNDTKGKKYKRKERCEMEEGDNLVN